MINKDGILAVLHEDEWSCYFNKRFRFNPKDWRLSYKVPIKWTTEQIEWLEENTPGRWQLEGWTASKSGVVTFSRSEDALAFKLRWL